MVARLSRPVTLSAEAPQWARRAFADAEQGYVFASPSKPQLLPQFLSTSLPNPADWVWCAVVLTDLPTLAFSNGTAWLRADGSAL